MSFYRGHLVVHGVAVDVAKAVHAAMCRILNPAHEEKEFAFVSLAKFASAGFGCGQLTDVFKNGGPLAIVYIGHGDDSTQPPTLFDDEVDQQAELSVREFFLLVRGAAFEAKFKGFVDAWFLSCGMKNVAVQLFAALECIGKATEDLQMLACDPKKCTHVCVPESPVIRVRHFNTHVDVLQGFTPAGAAEYSVPTNELPLAVPLALLNMWMTNGKYDLNKLGPIEFAHDVIGESTKDAIEAKVKEVCESNELIAANAEILLRRLPSEQESKDFRD